MAHPAGPLHAEVAHAPTLPQRPDEPGELTALHPHVWPRGARHKAA